MRLDPAICDRLRGILREEAEGWLASVPGQIEALCREWDLLLEGPCWGSYAFVFPCTAAGEDAVLKITHPTKVARPELRAMRAWDGRGAVRVLRQDESRGAMLLQRLRPGSDLVSLFNHGRDEDATAIACTVMRELPKLRLSDPAWISAAGRCEELEGVRPHFGGGAGPIADQLLDVAQGLFRDLVLSQSEQVLVHGDLHHENILRGGDQWVAIDPHGVIAEPAFEVGPLFRNPDGLFELPDLVPITRRRVDQIADLTNFPRERIVGWGIAQAALSAWWTIEAGDLDFGPALAVAQALRQC